MGTLARLVACWLMVAEAEPQAPAADQAGAVREGQASALPASLLPQAWGFLVPGRIRVVAVDADSVEGVVVAIYDDQDRLSVIRRKGGNWTKAWSRLLRTPANPEQQAPRILVKDLDGDGAGEILLCTRRLQIFAPAADGYDLEWESPAEDAFDESPVPQLGVADINHDGVTDVAVLNYKNGRDPSSSQSLYVYCGKSSAPLEFELAYATTFTDEHGYHSTAGLAVGDFNGDGNAEIIAGNDDGNLWLASFNGEAFAIRKHWSVPAGGAVGPGLCAGNLDDYAAAELLVGTNGGNIYVFNFDEKFEPRLAAAHLAGRLAYGVAAGDLDGDGRQEFVLTRGHYGYAGMTRFDVVAEAYQLRNGALERVWQEQTFDLPRPIVADLDGDGRDDIVVQSGIGSGIEAFEPRW